MRWLYAALWSNSDSPRNWEWAAYVDLDDFGGAPYPMPLGIRAESRDSFHVAEAGVVREVALERMHRTWDRRMDSILLDLMLPDVMGTTSIILVDGIRPLGSMSMCRPVSKAWEAIWHSSEFASVASTSSDTKNDEKL